MKQQQQATELNQQDYNNILALINKTPIQGYEAEGVAVLKHKLSLKLQPTPQSDGDEKPQKEK